jgi:hypothetical protein
VVKNLASSFCKVGDKEVDRKLVKRSKVAEGILKARGSSAPSQEGNAIKTNGKKGKGIARNVDATDKEKKDGATGGAALGAKKRPSK